MQAADIALGLGLAASGIVLARTANVLRARGIRASRPRHAAGAAGVFIGAEPILLGGRGRGSALIVHGFNDTPQSVRALSQFLAGHGWQVSAPLLPAHGRGAQTMAREGSAAEWVAATRAAWGATHARGGPTLLVGQSLGGALAVIAASEHPPTALVLLAPFLAVGTRAGIAARVWPLWSLVSPHLFSRADRAYHDPQARAQSLGNGEYTPRLVAEVAQVARAARLHLPDVQVPTLVVHARDDYRISQGEAELAYSAIGSADKCLLWRENTGHILSADQGREELFHIIGQWLDARFPWEGSEVAE